MNRRKDTNSYKSAASAKVRAVPESGSERPRHGCSRLLPGPGAFLCFEIQLESGTSQTAQQALSKYLSNRSHYPVILPRNKHTLTSDQERSLWPRGNTTDKG